MSVSDAVDGPSGQVSRGCTDQQRDMARLDRTISAGMSNHWGEASCRHHAQDEEIDPMYSWAVRSKKISIVRVNDLASMYPA